MEPEFITYQKFNDAALADELAEQLDKHGIAYIIKEEATGFDPSLVMSNEQVDYAVKIKGEDFEAANKLLTADAGESINEIEKDYYLFGFTDDELLEVITKADEWSIFDTVLARKILKDRSVDISDEQLAEISQTRIEELKIVEPTQTVWIVVGYLCAILGGVLGFFIGWHLSTFKRTLPDGERVYAYDESNRQQGKIIFYLSFIGLTIGLILKYYQYND